MLSLQFFKTGNRFKFQLLDGQTVILQSIISSSTVVGCANELRAVIYLAKTREECFKVIPDDNSTKLRFIPEGKTDAVAFDVGILNSHDLDIVAVLKHITDETPLGGLILGDIPAGLGA